MKKARVTTDFLDPYGFQTTVVERRFDQHFRVVEGEPRIALCGFDSASARSDLESAGFDFIVDVGIGGGAASFDRIRMNTFPDSRISAAELFGGTNRASRSIPQPFLDLAGKGQCGVLAENLAGLSIATSFVGMFASAFAVGEIIRCINGGDRALSLSTHLRSQPVIVRTTLNAENNAGVFARNGLVDVKSAMPSVLATDLGLVN